MSSGQHPHVAVHRDGLAGNGPPPRRAQEQHLIGDLFGRDVVLDRGEGEGEPLHLGDNPLRLERKGEILNIQKLFYLAVRHPRLIPLLRLLVKLPPNPLFNGIFKICLVRNYSRYKKLGLRKTLAIALKTRGIAQEVEPL